MVNDKTAEAIVYFPVVTAERNRLHEELEAARAEIARLKGWVGDLQSGMYVNCVYCGHRFGPGETTPVSMADALKEHVERCPEHPMSQLRAELESARELASCIVRVPPWERADNIAYVEDPGWYFVRNNGGWDEIAVRLLNHDDPVNWDEIAGPLPIPEEVDGGR